MSQFDSHNCHYRSLPDSTQNRPHRCRITLEHDLDPLDRELIERAFDSAWAAIKNSAILDYEVWV
jgi:hypothetical protein